MITDSMREMIERTALCYAATVNEDGTPNLSPKASLTAIDARHLGFCNIASPRTVANLRRNPAIEINVVDIFTRRGYRFKGRAEILDGGPDFDLVSKRFTSRAGPGYRVLDVVRIAVEEAKPVLSPLYTVRPDADVDEVRAHYVRLYTGASD